MIFNLTRRVVLVAMNTEPLYNRQVHIGRVAMYALGPKGEVIHIEVKRYGWFLSYLPGWSPSLEDGVQTSSPG